MISIVIPTFNEEGNIFLLAKKIKGVTPKDTEIIFVDDGSKDKTLDNIKALAAKDKNIHYISFSRNFGHQSALRAGLAKANGDAVISLDADMQHPPALLPDLIKAWHSGYDIVYTIRQEVKGSLPRRLATTLFYGIMNKLSGLTVEEGAADFRLLDRKVVEVINKLPENQLFVRGFVSWCGFKQRAIFYKPEERFSGQSKYSLSKLFSFAINGITQFSIKPLRAAMALGAASAIIGLIYGMYAFSEYLFHGNTTEGWTSVILTILIMGGVQLCVLGIFGEYLGKLFMQTKGRPDYIIMEESTSNVPKK